MPERTKFIRILIADDHPIFRHGLRALLSAEPSFSVVGEASDGDEAVARAQQLHPDILLLDLSMPRLPGLEALRRLSHSDSPVRTIVLTVAIETPQIVEALQLGARGIVLKEAATELVLKSIQAVMSGQYWVGREPVNDIMQYLRKLGPQPAQGTGPRTYGLTRRELEVVAAIVAGCTNKDIAQSFSLSEQTVKHHLTNIFDKLGVSNRLELALFAVQNGLTEPPQ